MPDMLFEFAKKFWLNVVAISIGKESTPALPWKVQWLKGRKCGKQTTYHTPHTVVSLERETEKLIHHQLFCHGSVVHKEIVLRPVVCLHVCPFVYPLFALLVVLFGSVDNNIVATESTNHGQKFMGSAAVATTPKKNNRPPLDALTIATVNCGRKVRNKKVFTCLPSVFVFVHWWS